MKKLIIILIAAVMVFSLFFFTQWPTTSNCPEDEQPALPTGLPSE